jgi:hypothetical protein
MLVDFTGWTKRRVVWMGRSDETIFPPQAAFSPLLKYRIVAFAFGIFILMRIHKRGFT